MVIPIAIGMIDTQESLTRLPNEFDIKADVVIPIAIGMIDTQESLTRLPNEFDIKADVVKLVDTLDLGSSAERCAGSSPSIRTKWSLSRPFFV